MYTPEAKLMKVAYCIRPDWETTHGGDSVQLVKTIEVLERDHGVRASIVSDPADPALKSADLVHIFNIQTAEISSAFGRAARCHGQTYAVSTIYWDLSHARFIDAMGSRAPSPCWRWLKFAFDGLSRLGGALVGRPRYLRPQRRRLVRELLTGAGVLLPNSAEEGLLVRNHFRLGNCAVQPVVNAIDAGCFCPPTVESERQGVCIVGRVQPIKNQLGLMAALADRRDVSITVVGAAQDVAYAEKVRDMGIRHGATTLIPSLTPQEVASLFQRSCVHVLPSFRESPGLSTLEALACGAKAVVSGHEFCPTDTYFRGLIDQSVFVADPYSPHSIRIAVDRALASTSRPDLSAWIEEFSWRNAGNQTMAGYRKALES